VTLTLVTVRCPRCGQTAQVPPTAVAVCNAYDRHHNRRSYPMVADPQAGTQTAMAGNP
jgi:hypothetical protein